MKNFLRNMDLDQVKSQISDLKGQMQDMRFRKPWTSGRDNAPVAYMAIGAALAFLGVALYKNRKGVASLCSNCGTDLKDKWVSSGMKEKAEKFMGKVKNGAQEAQNQASHQPG